MVYFGCGMCVLVQTSQIFPFHLGFSILWCTRPGDLQHRLQRPEPPPSLPAPMMRGGRWLWQLGQLRGYLTAESWAAGWRRTNCGSSSCTQKPSCDFIPFWCIVWGAQLHRWCFEGSWVYPLKQQSFWRIPQWIWCFDVTFVFSFQVR